MSEFLRYVLSELKHSFVLVLLAVIASCAVLAITYTFHKKKYQGTRKFPWGKAFLWLIFIGYLAVVLYATTFRSSLLHRSVNLHLFRGWREAWNYFSQHKWLNVLLNIAMFVPLGFLLPLLTRKLRKWYLTIPAGFLASLAIELLQLLLASGVFDVDDLFCNSMGAFIGYFGIMTLISLCAKNERNPKLALVCGCLTLLPVLAVCGLFLAYHVQPFGNLPCAPSFTVNTHDVRWELECELPSADGKLPVYVTQARTVAECDAFAEEFKSIIHTEYNTVSYYQEGAYYMDNSSEGGAHFLIVNYMDQGYEYTASFDMDSAWADTDRETVLYALEQYPLQIPEMAAFAAEGDGWHSFTVSRCVEDAFMYDGTLRVRYSADGSIREIQNGLLQYQYHEDAEIITPAQAYDLLCAGKFGSGELFTYINPETVTVLSCSISYEIDTKGFYQPVYLFALESEDGSYRDTVTVPAIR